MASCKNIYEHGPGCKKAEYLSSSGATCKWCRNDVTATSEPDESYIMLADPDKSRDPMPNQSSEQPDSLGSSQRHVAFRGAPDEQDRAHQGLVDEPHHPKHRGLSKAEAYDEIVNIVKQAYKQPDDCGPDSDQSPADTSISASPANPQLRRRSSVARILSSLHHHLNTLTWDADIHTETEGPEVNGPELRKRSSWRDLVPHMHGKAETHSGDPVAPVLAKGPAGQRRSSIKEFCNAHPLNASGVQLSAA
ncbi:hypothetical protein LTR56_015600 [Elasticomyces elasticus]|nr:hypothetical protein LTR56_015600 [Elasticomyces elasticus]KAK3652528.1 hypothetical protein LTR22_011615 [Elasticomyces elasticus]KAK4919233.1 hypothetical protein LTR49_013080 [Elasticomyces elasticus]KAK5757790.1 hypothetical protein LTS12_012108 [Elasticomyces elasticus]